jgi:hypothetical protein
MLGILVSALGGLYPTDLLAPFGYGFLGIAGALIAWTLFVCSCGILAHRHSSSSPF